jgi:hypothetical protein
MGQAKCERVDLTSTRFAGVHSLSNLRGTRMALPDILDGAMAFAAALGIEALDQD